MVSSCEGSFLWNFCADLSCDGVCDAMQSLADAVTQCKFEATYSAFDECVLSRILDVLVQAVSAPQGHLLSHDNLISIFQACYRIGHYQTERRRDTSELLMKASRRAMQQLISAIFTKISSVASRDTSALAGHPLHSTARLHVSTESLSPSSSHPLDEEQEQGNAHAVGDAAEHHQTTATTAIEAPGPGDVHATMDTVTQHHEIVSLLSPSRIPAGTEEAYEGENRESVEAASTPRPEIPSIAEADVVPPADYDASQRGYGVEALYEVMKFVISFVAAPPSSKHPLGDLPVHGLELVLAALYAGGPSLVQYEPLLVLLRRDLVRALFAAARTASLPCLAGICQVALALYVHCGDALLLQVESILELLLIPIAEGRKPGSTSEMQQVALEGIIGFCCQPSFVHNAYINYDCRIKRFNVYEHICTLLSKAAFPVNGPVNSVHVLALDGIMAILTSLGINTQPPLHEYIVPATCLSEKNGTGDEQANMGFVDIWSPLARGEGPPALEYLKLNGIQSLDIGPAQAFRAEKLLKSRLATVAEHFNREIKKGLQYCQSLNLLPKPLDPLILGRFLRYCPGLNKAAIGEVLGERDSFYDKVRDAFIDTFNFNGLDFDMALRLFMDAFRPPGEGQKIDRIMQIFGRQYYLQAGQLSGLKSADAAYVLAFSVIMLNTDLHNSQNKKKMSPEDFARINDNTNDGDPMPKELLDRIYKAIAAKELKISSECGADEMAGQLVYWEELEREANQSHSMFKSLEDSSASISDIAMDSSVEKDMFALVWGPTLAAVSVVLDGTSDALVSRRAVDGLLVAARLATQHGITDVADQLLSTLSKYTAALNVASSNLAVDLGNSEKAKAALEATFAIANLYGDMVHSGWRHVLDCIVRLHKADLLPPLVIAADGEGREEAALRMPRPLANNSNKGKASSGASLFSRAINSLISIESGDPAASESSLARDQAARAAAIETAEACRVDYLIADSKFLIAESLVEFVKATMWAGGNVVIAARTGEGSDTAELALELLISLTLRNRDRVGLIWPLIHEYLAACISPETSELPSTVAIRAVLGLFRVCQRVLPYKDDDTAGMLIASLGLVVNMAPRITLELADRIASEVLLLIKTGGRYIKTEHDWRTVLALLRIASMKPDAVPLVYESLSAACHDRYIVRAESYMPLLETCLLLIDRYKGGGNNVEAAAKFLDCADALFVWLPKTARIGRVQEEEDGDGEADGENSTVPVEVMMELWLTSVGVLARGLCREEIWQLRDTSVAALHRTLLASSSLNLPAEIWIQTIGELLVPLVEDLAKIGSSNKTAKSRPGIEKTVRLAVNMLTKVLLQYVPLIDRDNDFFSVWSRALDSLQQCMLTRSEAVMESVPENTKNLLLVLATCGVLNPEWVDCHGQSLWDLTWSKASGISLALSPALLSDILEKTKENGLQPGDKDSDKDQPNHNQEKQQQLGEEEVPQPTIVESEQEKERPQNSPAPAFGNGDGAPESQEGEIPRKVESQSLAGSKKQPQVDASKVGDPKEDFHDAQEQTDQQQLQASDEPVAPACKQS